MTQLNEITVTWWCCRCNRTGRLLFYNGDTVGERLEAARVNHQAASPGCELDWNEVLVRTETEELGNRR